MSGPEPAVRVGEVAEAGLAAALLDAFNREFDSPTPGVEVIAPRLEAMLARDDVVLLLAGDPPVAFALMTLRPVVWDAGPVTFLDELYVRPDLRGQGIGGALLERALDMARARGTETFEINVDEGDTNTRRFYAAHGFTDIEPETGERAFYYHRRLVED